jgi:copper resistance protein D
MTEGIWLLLRAAGLVLSVQTAGAGIFATEFAPGPRARGLVGQWVQGLARAAFAVALVQLLYEPVHLAGAWSGALSPALWRILWSDSATLALVARLLGLLLLTVAPVARWNAWAGAVLIVGSFLLTGHTHAAADAAVLGVLLALHVSLAAFWSGALWPLILVLRSEPEMLAGGCVTRFSRYALWAVPLLALAGLGLAALLLPGIAALGQPYGRTLLFKLGMFLAAFALAAYHRLQLTPALIRREPGASARLGRSIQIEYGLICGVLVLTAILSGCFSPAGD